MSIFRWRKTALLGLVLLAVAETRAADWGTAKIHAVRGQAGSWNMQLSNGQTYGSLTVDVGANCYVLSITTGIDGHGGSGNCDLYVRYGAEPTTSAYDRRSRRANHQEAIFIYNPAPGRYYFGLYGKSTYRTCLKVTTMSQSTWHNNGWRAIYLDAFNWHRVIRGRRLLSLNSRLNAAAQRHAADMVRYGYYGHTGRTAAMRTPALRVAASGYRARSVLENISAQSGKFDTFWMNNARDRANLLNADMRHLGLGFKSDGNRHRFVAVFARPR